MIKSVSCQLSGMRSLTRIKDLLTLCSLSRPPRGPLEQRRGSARYYYSMHGRCPHTRRRRKQSTDEVRKADERFSEYKQKVNDATSLTVLDAMITQLQNYKDQVCKWIESILHEAPPLPARRSQRSKNRAGAPL